MCFSRYVFAGSKYGQRRDNLTPARKIPWYATNSICANCDTGITTEFVNWFARCLHFLAKSGSVIYPIKIDACQKLTWPRLLITFRDPYII